MKKIITLMVLSIGLLSSMIKTSDNQDQSMILNDHQSDDKNTEKLTSSLSKKVDDSSKTSVTSDTETQKADDSNKPSVVSGSTDEKKITTLDLNSLDSSKNIDTDKTNISLPDDTIHSSTEDVSQPSLDSTVTKDVSQSLDDNVSSLNSTVNDKVNNENLSPSTIGDDQIELNDQEGASSTVTTITNDPDDLATNDITTIVSKIHQNEQKIQALKIQKDDLDNQIKLIEAHNDQLREKQNTLSESRAKAIDKATATPSQQPDEESLSSDSDMSNESVSEQGMTDQSEDDQGYDDTNNYQSSNDDTSNVSDDQSMNESNDYNQQNFGNDASVEDQDNQSESYSDEDQQGYLDQDNQSDEQYSDEDQDYSDQDNQSE